MENTLTGTTDIDTICTNESILTINDKRVGENIQPFRSICKITRQPCTVRPMPVGNMVSSLAGTSEGGNIWHNYALPFADINERILTESSYFFCTIGTTRVKISDPGQDTLRVGDEACAKSELYAFLEAAEQTFGPLSDEQQQNVELLIDAFVAFGDGDAPKMAYILSTGFHESRFSPIREAHYVFSSTPTDARLGAFLANWYVPSPAVNYTSPPAFTLPDPVTGEYYFGRGFVQITHKSNYEKYTNVLTTHYGQSVDLVNDPGLALNPEYAALITVHGMVNGGFTGAKLGDYINGSQQDFGRARRIVGGLNEPHYATDARDVLQEYENIIAAPSPNNGAVNGQGAPPEGKLIAVDGAAIICPNAMIQWPEGVM